MQRICGVAVVVLLGGSVTVAEPLWTETFDTGVGRFDQTRGLGDTVFVHDPVDGNLNATFVRRMQGLDRRLAPLGRTFSEADVASFSLEWTPLQSDWYPWPSIGFFNTASNQHIAGIKVADTGSGDQSWNWLLPVLGDPGIPGLQWGLGETYFLEFGIDGPAHSATMSISVLTGGSFVQQFTSSMSFPAVPYEFDTLGMGNIQDPSGSGDGNTFIADIDNFSFTPEPSTAILLFIGSLVALRRRRI